MTNALKKAIEIGFDKRQKPSGFLANLFEKKQLKTIKVQIQGRAVKAVYAVDVKTGTGGRRFELSQHDSKDIVIPEYNEYTTLGEVDMFKCQLGESETTQTMANIANLVNDNQEVAADMIRRSENKQAADAIFQGEITLADGSKIEFNKKATHDIDCTNKKWDNDTNNPLTQISNACDLIRTDGKTQIHSFMLICSDKGLTALLGNANVKGSSNWNNGIKRNDINIPEEKTIGGLFHGRLTCGTDIVDVWSCNEKYEIPEGFNFAGEGTSVPYIPDGAIALVPLNPNFKRYYGALNDVNSKGMLGGAKLQLVEKEQVAYAYDKVNGGSVVTEVGVKSRVVCVPVGVDELVTFKNVV